MVGSKMKMEMRVVMIVMMIMMIDFRNKTDTFSCNDHIEINTVQFEQTNKKINQNFDEHRHI